MKDYTVVFNSRKFATGAVRNDLTYQFDWSQFADEDYKVSFTYTADVNNLNTPETVQVLMNLGGNMHSFETASSNYANKSLYLGCLRFNTATVSALEANTTQNASIYLKGRPTNQSPRIQILDGAGDPFLDTAGTQPNHYILTLKLERV